MQNEFEELLEEEEKLKNLIEQEESEIAKAAKELDERLKRIPILKNNVKNLKEKLDISEREIAVKDAQYDKQLSSGKQMDNLPIKHAQKAQEVESLQNALIDLENKKDDLHMAILRKTEEVRRILMNIFIILF